MIASSTATAAAALTVAVVVDNNHHLHDADDDALQFSLSLTHTSMSLTRHNLGLVVCVETPGAWRKEMKNAHTYPPKSSAIQSYFNRLIDVPK